MVPSECFKSSAPQPTTSALERGLRAFSVVTMLLTIPQVTTIWLDGNASGVSLVSWGSYLASACLWFVYGVQKRDKTIYVACLGWILLDAAVVAGVVFHT